MTNIALSVMVSSSVVFCSLAAGKLLAVAVVLLFVEGFFPLNGFQCQIRKLAFRKSM